MLETTIAVLENGSFAHCFASGVAAISMVFHFAKPGDHILCVDDVYVGTHLYLQEVAVNHGLTTTYVDFTVIENIDKHIQPNTKVCSNQILRTTYIVQCRYVVPTRSTTVA